MRQYIITIAITLLFSLMVKYTRSGQRGSKDERLFKAILLFAIYVMLTLFIGLRTQYNDTAAYRAAYERLATFSERVKGTDFDLGDHIGFITVNSILRSFGISTQGYLLLYSAFILGVMLHFLYKNSVNFSISLFLFFMTNAYSNTGAALKQSTAVAFGLLAISMALQKNWTRFFVLIAIGALFHPYIVLYLIVPFLFFKPWGKGTLLLVIGSLVAGFALERLFDTILDITTLLGSEYTEEKIAGSGINTFRILVANVPLLLCLVYRRDVVRNSTRKDNLFINLATINGAIMFVGRFGSSIAFSRLATYFTIFQCLALPSILAKIRRKEKLLIYLGMFVGYTLFFMYANRGFDVNFSRITFWQYLRSIF